MVSFLTVSNHVYEVDYANSLIPRTQWNFLPHYLTGSDLTMSITDTNPATQRFYRVKVW